MYSWGSGKYGQLGHATRLDERYPRKVEVDRAIGPFTQVSCGDRHTAAVTRKCRRIDNTSPTCVCDSNLLRFTDNHHYSEVQYTLYLVLIGLRLCFSDRQASSCYLW